MLLTSLISYPASFAGVGVVALIIAALVYRRYFQSLTGVDTDDCSDASVHPIGQEEEEDDADDEEVEEVEEGDGDKREEEEEN